jgi:hypothetical protein
MTFTTDHLISLICRGATAEDEHQHRSRSGESMTGTWCPGNEQRPSRLHQVAQVSLAIWLPAIDAMVDLSR